MSDDTPPEVEYVTRSQAAIARMQALITQIQKGEVLVEALVDSSKGMTIEVSPMPPQVPSPASPIPSEDACFAGTVGCGGTKRDLTEVLGQVKCYLCGGVA